MRMRIVEYPADRRVVAPHHSLQPIQSAEHVRLVDELRTADANENIFGVVRHADNFMRDNLPKGDNQVKTAVEQQMVDLNVNRLIHNAF